MRQGEASYLQNKSKHFTRLLSENMQAIRELNNMLNILKRKKTT